MNGGWRNGLLVGAIGGAVVVAGAMRLLSGPAEESAGESARGVGAAEVLAVLQADLNRGLDRWYSGDPFGYSDLYADELSYFDPGTDVSLDGIAALRAYYEPLVDRFHIERYETENMRLQLHGDIGILTFNLNEHAAGDPPSAEWKVTQVYRNIGDEWRIIHGHFSSPVEEFDE
jgi:hypothetical protein